MKKLLGKLVAWQLAFLADLYLRRYEPLVIAVTGNVGKTSTKEAIAAVVSSSRRVRASAGNMNNEFGVPLTILGDWSGTYYEKGSNIFFWASVFIKGVLRLIFYPDYPEVLVMEYGADKPGDIRDLARKFKPHIGVITAIGEVPVHVEFFSGPEAVAREKAKLIETLEPIDYAVLNSDDDAVLDMKSKTKARVTTYGFGEGTGVRISNFDFKTEGNMPIGVSFKLNYGGETMSASLPAGQTARQGFVPVTINGSLGKSLAYASAAAAAVGIALGINLVEISDALSYYDGPKGRLKILGGIKNSWLIDDTYNSSPASAHMALDALRSLPAKRRIAVLGDMLELGRYSVQAHQAVGNLAGSFVDILVCVGLSAKFIADAAGNQMPKENIYVFATADSARKKIQELVQEGDLVLIKGSQGIRMEKITEEIMADPGKKDKLLVRQSKKWLNK